MFDIERMGEYKAIIIPVHLLANEVILSAVEAYTSSGGTVVTTGDFMHKSEDNWRVYGEIIERLEQLSGLSYKKLLLMPQSPEQCCTFRWNDQTYRCDGFLKKTFAVQSASLQVLASVETPLSDKGAPVAVRHTYGTGTFVSLLSLPEQAFVKKLLAELLPEAAGVETMELPRNVELVRLYDRNGKLDCYFVINKSGAPFTLSFPTGEASAAVPDRSGMWVPASGCS